MTTVTSKPGLISASSPVTCICIGTISGLLWFTNAYALSYEVRPYMRGPVLVDNGIPAIAAMIAALMCSFISALMIHGVTQKRAGYMFPWLAIHWVLVVIGSSMAISVLYRIALESSLRTIAVSFLSSTFSIAALLWVWMGVYLHYSQLMTRIPILPTCVNEGKILKKPEEPQNPYYSV